MNPILTLRRSASAFGASEEASTPSSLYEPDVGRSRQPTIFMKVDLPEPDGPITITIWPGQTLSETPRRAATTVSPIRYSLRRSVTSMTGVTLPLTPGGNAPLSRGSRSAGSLADTPVLVTFAD